jgi:two-component system CheB/CheR fusion protein
LNSTEVATIFFDRELNISRYTEKARVLVNLIQTDIGRPLGDLASTLSYDRLVADCELVLQSLVFKETEVQSKDSRWYWT